MQQNARKLAICWLLLLLKETANAQNLDETLAKCCAIGEKWSTTSLCDTFNGPLDTVPDILQGLCYSTIEICCSKRQRMKNCEAGQLAARTGLACDPVTQSNHGGSSTNRTADTKPLTKVNMNVYYRDCCEACKIGLVRGSTDDAQCNLNNFNFGAPWDTAYEQCCNDSNNSNAFYLNETEDICNKFDMLCSQICENTDDSYICKCNPGYQLLEDKITCIQIFDYHNTNTIIAGNDDKLSRMDNNRDDNNSGHGDRDNKNGANNGGHMHQHQNCPIGYRMADDRKSCVDINECELGLAKCNLESQACYNTPGNYTCLNIYRANNNNDAQCTSGYRFNVETELCDDINECIEELDNCDRVTHLCRNLRGTFTCTAKPIAGSGSGDCIHGFEYNRQTNMCQDINECQQNRTICPIGYRCVNKPGDYDCRRSQQAPEQVQNVGDTNKRNNRYENITNRYDRITTGGLRKDVTRIAVPTIATTAAVLLNCALGFRRHQDKCIDIDECLTDRNACDTNQVCTNESGGYRCDCRIGFTLDSITNACIDVNECQINAHDCLETQRCDNTIGSYTCIRLQSCGTGYTLNAQTGSCDDDDECILKTHNCLAPYECRNTKGSFRCNKIRPTRYGTTTTTVTPSTTAMSPTTRTTMASIRPTVSGTSDATSVVSQQSSAQTGVATTSRSFYVPTTATGNYYPAEHSNTNDELNRYYGPCNVGLQRNVMGACVDINECEQQDGAGNGVCSRNQRCVNTNGSYQCRNLLICTGGFESNNDGTACVDIDECERKEATCGPDQVCRNKPGGYICYCPPGHILDPQKRCRDINECEYGNVCSSNAICTNTIGSYRCECRTGFRKQDDNDKLCNDIDECQEINGLCEQRCVNYWGSYRCACELGYLLSDNNRTCDDIDECEEHKSLYLCLGICNNIPGSYACSCPEGYRLGSDGRSCEDIDECTETNVCRGPNEICTNIRGSFRCHRIDCPRGYTIDPRKQNRCKRISMSCNRDDYECLQMPFSYSYNFITLASKSSIPPTGVPLLNLKAATQYERFEYDMSVIRVHAPSSVHKADERYFSLIRLDKGVMLTLLRTLDGPQEIQIDLKMQMFTSGQLSGSNIAKLFIIVSEYEY